MIFQTVLDGSTQEVVFRAVRNSTTKTSTVTIAAGVPLILETATASANGIFAAAALTFTSVINNLFIGMNNAALPADSMGLCQVYGVDTDAIVATAGAAVGASLVPNIGTLVTVAAAGTGTLPGVLTAPTAAVLLAPSGAAQVATSVFLNCL